MGYVNVSEAASQMGVSVRRVQQMCKSGEISGAIKKGRSWMIPADEENDVQSTKNPSPKKRLPLPIGISDYKLATTEYYYVDKTLLIRDFLDSRPMVSLFTRPRRFGKSFAAKMHVRN